MGGGGFEESGSTSDSLQVKLKTIGAPLETAENLCTLIYKDHTMSQDTNNVMLLYKLLISSI